MLVRVNCPSEELARRIGDEMVSRALVACANIGAEVRSIYVWRGKRCEETESVLWLKTLAGHWPELRRAVTELHPDEVPAILALPVADCHPAYRLWMEEVCSHG